MPSIVAHCCDSIVFLSAHDTKCEIMHSMAQAGMFLAAQGLHHQGTNSHFSFGHSTTKNAPAGTVMLAGTVQFLPPLFAGPCQTFQPEMSTALLPVLSSSNHSVALVISVQEDGATPMAKLSFATVSSSLMTMGPAHMQLLVVVSDQHDCSDMSGGVY